MVDGIYIFDNILSEEKQDILENYFLNSKLKWKDINNTTFLDEDLPQKVLAPKFIFDLKIKDIISEIENNVAEKLKTSIHTNYRYKVNLLESSKYIDNRNNKKSIHIDRFEPHLSMVYYVNDSDGDTKFYNLHGKVQEWMKYVSSNELDRFSEIKSVSPQKGKIVVFNGFIPHHSSYPRIHDRYVINFNSVIKTNPKSVI